MKELNQSEWLEAIGTLTSLRLQKLDVPNKNEVIEQRIREIRDLVLKVIEENQQDAGAGHILRYAAAIIPTSKKSLLMDDNAFRTQIDRKISEEKTRKQVEKLIEIDDDFDSESDPVEDICSKLNIDLGGQEQIIREILEHKKDDEDAKRYMENLLIKYFVTAKSQALNTVLLAEELKTLKNSAGAK